MAKDSILTITKKIFLLLKFFFFLDDDKILFLTVTKKSLWQWQNKIFDNDKKFFWLSSIFWLSTIRKIILTLTNLFDNNKIYFFEDDKNIFFDNDKKIFFWQWQKFFFLTMKKKIFNNKKSLFWQWQKFFFFLMTTKSIFRQGQKFVFYQWQEEFLDWQKSIFDNKKKLFWRYQNFFFDCPTYGMTNWLINWLTGGPTEIQKKNFVIFVFHMVDRTRCRHCHCRFSSRCTRLKRKGRICCVFCVPLDSACQKRLIFPKKEIKI